ncbi:MAG: restriction endonuclease subunit S, partial [Saprospiraceae bacterium]|nr:restriction endonuclease subunit S [Saprospiraceae bacterium]
IDTEYRLEPAYHLPEIVALEQKIQSKSSKKLKHYIKSVASGATPSVQEETKYYTDNINGIPFLRVQNLQPNGSLYLDDLKYINLDTHNSYLKRSQVSEGDLLVKITGVGRMAIASVAPAGFVGNTNQHMVVIKTNSLEESTYLANYLNLDIIERLASRRATGGTRPALDYQALKSIPIIENIDFSILNHAYTLKLQKESEAQALLQSIDTYILDQLGITIPEQRNDIEDRMFYVEFDELETARFDPSFYNVNTKNLKNAILSSPFNKSTLKNLLIHSSAGDWGQEFNNDTHTYEECLVIRATEFKNNGNLDLDNNRVKFRYINKDKLKKMDLQPFDLLIEKSGGSIDQPVGRVALITNEILQRNTLAFSNFIQKIRVDGNLVLPEFLFYYLKVMHNVKLTESMQSQTNGIRNLIMGSFYNQHVVLPSIDIQRNIVNHVNMMHSQINALKSEAQSILDDAKAQIEKMILA